ncbi:MAG: M13 family metallopeptidase [Gammaproteobacteria bacterium]|jgi:endothelin-converting enzyme/putative endopeptidase
MKHPLLRITLAVFPGLIVSGCGETTTSEPAPPPAAAATQAPASAAQIGAWGIDLSARDESVDPGDDFDRYVNGSWFDAYEIPADLPRFGAFVELALEAEEDVRAIVEDLSASAAPVGSVEQKVGDYYASWMNTDLLEELGATPLAPHLEYIESIDSKDELKEAFANLHLMAPFGIGIIPDPADTTRYIAFVEQGGLGLPDRDYYLNEAERFVDYRAAYRDYIATVLGLAGFNAATARAEAIFDFERRIAEVHWPPEDSRDIQKIYNPMSAAQVTELAPEIPWVTIFERLGLGDVETFVVAETTAIDAASQIVDEASLEVLKDYLAFHFIRTAAPYLSHDFDDAHFEFFSRTLQGNEEQRERWKRGVGQINQGLGEAVGRIYVERHFPEAAEEGMNDLVANLVAAMQERLRENDWMDDETREQALAKLATFEPRIGYPSKWTDYSALDINAETLLENALAIREFDWQQQLERLAGPVDRELWDMSPQTVNAYYNPLLNQITFPAAILQPPFFDPAADAAVNFGGIGAVIGHEIGHGFDDQGRRFDEQGRIRDWWTATADERFSERSQELGEQYDSYEALPGMFINGQLTMGENIGDLGGLQMAYAAYHRYLDEHAGGEAPVIDGLTGDQRFFLSWAQVWRSKAREDYTRARLVSDPHSPPRYRINGVVRNLDAWYDAFGVSEDNDLYLPPEQRVRIW